MVIDEPLHFNKSMEFADRKIAQIRRSKEITRFVVERLIVDFYKYSKCDFYLTVKLKMDFSYL